MSDSTSSPPQSATEPDESVSPETGEGNAGTEEGRPQVDEAPWSETGPDGGDPSADDGESSEDVAGDDHELTGDDGVEAEASPAERVAVLENEGDIAADYLEELLDIADLDGDLDIDVEGERAAVSIIGADVSDLVGPDGRTLEALQELTRLAVLRETGERSRLMLDVGGYRAARRAELEKVGTEAAAQVQETGEPKKLERMTPFERKVVHDAVAEAGLRSESEGEEPDRCVVVLPTQP